MNTGTEIPSQVVVLTGSQPAVAQSVADANGTALRVMLTIRVDSLPLSPPATSFDEGIAEAAVDLEAPALNYDNRNGYDPGFLSHGHAVPLPTLSATIMRDVARLKGTEDFELKYTHFSVVMNRQRRMPFYTAVNIDGQQLRRIPRGDKWFKDNRIDSLAQFGNEIYSNNDLDRGHMVRRLNPVWGTDAEASQANDDTFHYTNACPQHKDLNQRTWNDLEDYILDNAGAHNFRVSVFTGPVFRADDRRYRTARLPREFWKVAVLVNEESGRLSATAYLLSQAGMIDDLEFVLGPFRTYQISVAQVQALTDVHFGNLSDFDPIGLTESAGLRVINRPEDIQF